MAKQYVVTILLEGKDKNLKKTLRSSGRATEEFADTAETAGNRVQQAFTGAAIAMAFGKSIPIMQKAIDMYARAESATTSLGSAIEYSGESFDAARKFLEEYTKDGLIPLAQASLSLKNLLFAGYGLERSMEIMRALKDYAAFGRQGQLSMGEAVEGATQGLKNQMSQMVDNAGFTRNLNRLYADFARTIGKGAGSLTEAEKVTATYLGIMKEWPSVQGNAKKASNQLVGAMARQDARARELYETLGEGLDPAYQKILGVLGPVTDAVTAFAKVNPEATATLLGGAGLIAAVAALAAAFTLIGGPGAIIVGVTAGIVGMAAAVTTLANKIHPSNEAIANTAREAGEAADRVKELKNEYVELEGKPDKSAEEQDRLREVMEELARLVPDVVKAFDDEGEVLELNTSRLDEYVRAMEIVRDMNIEEYESRVTEAQREREAVQARLSARIAAYDTMVRRGIDSTKEFTGTVVEGGEEIYGMSEDMVSSTVSVEDLQKQIRALAAELRAAEEEEKRAKRTLRELRGETEETKDEVEETGEETEKAGDSVKYTREELQKLAEQLGWTQEAAEGWDRAMSVFVEKYGRPPEGWEEWQEFLEIMSFKEVKAGADEAGEAIQTLEERYGSFTVKLAEGVAQWDDWGDFAVDAMQKMTNTFGQALGLLLQRNEDIEEKLEALWDNFVDWFLMRIGEMIAKMIFLNTLEMAFPGLGSVLGFLGGEQGGTVTRGAGLPRAQHGGQLRGTVPGIDRYPVLASIDETFLSTDLTRRMERMVTAFETQSVERQPARVPRDPFASRHVPSHYSFTIVTPDAETFRTMIRNGSLGREMKLAEDHNKLPRR